MGLGLAFAFDQAGQRKHDGKAGDENEQRENEVVKMQALPGDVNELAADEVADSADSRAFVAGHLGQRGRGAVDAEQPEQVDAAQRIDRPDAAGLQNL